MNKYGVEKYMYTMNMLSSFCSKKFGERKPPQGEEGEKPQGSVQGIFSLVRVKCADNIIILQGKKTTNLGPSLQSRSMVEKTNQLQANQFKWRGTLRSLMHPAKPVHHSPTALRLQYWSMTPQVLTLFQALVSYSIYPLQNKDPW